MKATADEMSRIDVGQAAENDGTHEASRKST